MVSWVFLLCLGPRCFFLSYKNKDINWNLVDTLLVTTAVGEVIMSAFNLNALINVSALRVLRLLRFRILET